MSRTDKDRPYWVIQNDHTLGVVEQHNHLNLGREHILIKDRGVLEEYTEVLPAPLYYDLTRGWVRERTITRRRWVGQTTEVVVAPAECTAHMNYPRGDDDRQWIARPCWTEIPEGPRRYRYTERPSRARVRGEYYVPERRAVRDELHVLVGEYNTFRDVDGDWSVAQHRHTPYKGGWWD